MMQNLSLGLLFLATVAFMEFFAWFMHRYVMHGFLWCWHESHHRPRTGRYELNDLFALVFSLPAIALIAYGTRGHSAAIALGLGVTAYGIIYSLFHDGLVHRRFQTFINPESAFWKPRIQAHRVHHAVNTKDGCVSFGFLIVQPVQKLKIQLADVRAKVQNARDMYPAHTATTRQSR